MNKDADAFRTISEVAGELDLPQHVLRFWETRFPQIKPMKRAGGRRYYRPRDIGLLRAIKHLLYKDGYTIRGVQRVLKEQGAGALAAMTDVAESGPLDFSGPEGQEETRLQGLLPESEDVGSIPRTLRPSGPRLAESTSVAERDDAAGKTRDEPLWGLSLTEADIERLRAALAELAECENILDAARRR
jgi:DNA-binding transcriptional MerR regulator